MPEKKFRLEISGPSQGVSAVYENYRRYHRYSVSAKALITRHDANSPKRLSTQVTTISQGGLGFYADILFEKATPVSVELLISDRDMEILEGRIASICSEGNNYFVGIAFNRDIPYEQFVEIFG